VVMSATEVTAEIKALLESERDRVLGYLVADAELREDLQFCSVTDVATCCGLFGR
jgi:hypothetical protein